MDRNFSLSVVILSRNSKPKIVDCIKSVSGWADEIIMVDGLSNDGCIEMAESLGVNVYSHKFLGSFAEERNFGIEQSHCDWVLQLDSDEVVSDELKKQCDLLLATTKFSAFKFLRRNFFLGHEFKYGGWYHYSQHLLKRGFAHYEDRVHEKMVVNGEVGVINADVLHYPFDSIGDFVTRQNRYTDLQALDILDSSASITEKEIRYNLTIKPFKMFKKIYFNKRGYKEGMYGYVFCILNVFVHILKWIKVWDKFRQKAENGNKPRD
jgi:glycosyltransferase involved in cell wall biosynthesis